MPIWAAAIAGGAQLAGGFAGASAERGAVAKQNRQDEAQRAAAFKYLDRVRSRDQVFGGLENAALLQGQAGERQGFAGAKKAIDLGANVARQGLIQRGAQNQAATEQSIVSQGLQGTSTGAQAFAGVGDQTNMQLAGIDAQLAQAFADLNLQEGALLGQQGRERTQLAGRNRQAESDFGYEQASLAPRMTAQQTVGLREGLWGTQPGTGSQRNGWGYPQNWG